MMNVKIKVYDQSKYNAESQEVAEVEYQNIKGFEVKIIEDEEIYNMGFDDVDENKEYLILTTEDGETSTFRNSLIDLFRI